MTMNNKMNLKYNNLKINTNLHDAINTNKTHKGLNSINLGKSNYHSNTNIANEMNTINNIFSSFMINSPVQKNKDAADLLNPRNILKNERIEENKTIMHTPTNKGPIENRKIINFYENNLIYNSDISPNFYHSYDPKSTRNSYKSYDSNKFKTLETSSNMFDDNLKYNIDHNKSNKEEKSKIMTDNSKHTYKSDNTKGRKDLYASYDNNSNKETANKLNIAEDDKNRDSINIMNLIANENYVPLSVKNLNLNFPNYNPSKYSTKSMSNVKAYAANTYQGIVRNYNEDRVSIILNIVKPSSYKGNVWPKCSFFGIYDGHGGSSCADFLRDKLHQFIIKDPNFPSNVPLAIKNAFEASDKEFLSNIAINRNGDVVDRSGSCAIIALMVDNICYSANVGDSRAVLSSNVGKKIIQISNDHKPNEYSERKRIIDAGGSVYQTQTPARNYDVYHNNPSVQVLLGPYRVFPGRLSVARAFGNVEAKFPKYGGNSNVLISSPEIRAYEITRDLDFLVIGCKRFNILFIKGDGIFDLLSNEDVIKSVWMTTEDRFKSKNIHEQCGVGVDMIIKSAMSRKSLDNVTCLIIAFENFEKTLFSDYNHLSGNPKEIHRPSVLSSMQYYQTASTLRVKDNTDELARQGTNSFVRNNSSNASSIKNSLDDNNEHYNNNFNPTIKYNPGVNDKHPKKVTLDLSGSNRRVEDQQMRKNGEPRLSFAVKSKISPFSMSEANTHYPLSTKNIDTKHITYNGINGFNKFISSKKGY